MKWAYNRVEVNDMKQLILAAALVALTGCSTTPQYRVSYGLDSAGNLVEKQVPVQNDNRILETTAIILGGIVGIYVLGEIFEVWDDDKPAPVAPAPAEPSNPLFQTGGTSTQTWEGNFVQPVYQAL